MTVSNCSDSSITPCSGQAYLTPAQFMEYWFYSFDPEAEVYLGQFLQRAASRIDAALAASGQCNCNLAPWAGNFLGELNAMIAAVMFNIPCVRLSPEQRELYAGMIALELERLRSGDYQICQGATSKDFPAFAIAEYTLTPRARAEKYLREEIGENNVK